MRKIKLKNLNNQGSTFVMAIIVITLVTMLAVAVLMASTHNIAMKNVDRNAKDTFYTAETIMDAIGYDNSSYFYRKFREKYGCSPKDYRRKI